MLSDDYISVTDQLRATKAALVAEQRKSSALERHRDELAMEAREAATARREAEARAACALDEIAADDESLVPRVHRSAVEAADLQMRLAETQRDGAQRATAAASRAHEAEAGLARANERAAAHEGAVDDLKKRLRQSLSRTRELQASIDEANDLR